MTIQWNKISVFMLRVAKFEFVLMNADITFAHVETATGIVKGMNWTRVAQRVEETHPFAKFDFDNPPIRIFKETSPQYLVKSPDGPLKWDSDDEVIASWDRLLPIEVSLNSGTTLPMAATGAIHAR